MALSLFGFIFKFFFNFFNFYGSGECWEEDNKVEKVRINEN